jgi:C-terminal processing protease CtpA/Prc
MTYRAFTFLALLLALVTNANAQDANKWRADALAIPGLINDDYAYLDHLPGGKYALTQKMQSEAEAVSDEKSLLKFAERALFLLADHHAITGGSFNDSWALIPSYSDIWIELQSGQYYVTSVRGGSVAEQAGIRKGAVLVSVSGYPVADAVKSFWSDLGVTQFTDEQANYAARTLVAGRRDRPREITVKNSAGRDFPLTLASRYTIARDTLPVRIVINDHTVRIILSDSLGNSDTITEFDKAMMQVGLKHSLIIDLRDTASGGNTSVARAIMGWFVNKPTSYQMHQSPAEERQTGVPRQWIEQVLPRKGKYHKGQVTVLVGRWTGSMGEGLAIGMKAVGAKVQGDPMAHLLGAVEDIHLPNSGMVIKLPTERLYTVDGIPRENFIPEPVSGNIAGYK